MNLSIENQKNKERKQIYLINGNRNKYNNKHKVNKKIYKIKILNKKIVNLNTHKGYTENKEYYRIRYRYVGNIYFTHTYVFRHIPIRVG